MFEKIIAGILFLMALSSFFMSIRSFKEKGLLLNNAYIYASKKERDSMNKKPYYTQSAIIFLFIGFVFLLNAIAVFFTIDWIFYIVILLIISTIIYAIVSSIIINKKCAK